MSTNVILEMRNITKTFPGVVALRDVSFSVEEGEIHALCGENGAGKSTLMKVLSGVYPHGTYDGEIYYKGELKTFGSIRDTEEEGIIIIHQELALIPMLSIAENIFLGNEVAKGGVINWAEATRRTSQLLAKVGLKENPSTLITHIGVGKQQLVEIAKALSKNVKLLILDEPTAALNDEDSAHLLGLMRTLKAEGMTQIIISHKLNEVMAIADSITIVRDGSVVESMDNTQRGPDRVTEGRIIRSMVGRSLDNRFPERDVPIGEELLRLEDWTVYHPDDTSRVVVEGAALDVRAGEVVGIAGLMGAGRTELAMSVFGHQYGSRISGQVYLHGRQIDTSTVRRAIANGLAYVSEDRKKYGLNLIAEIRHNISGAALRKVSRRGVIDKPRENAVARDYRDKMRIRSSSIQQRVGNLSGGNQQKVVLSKWMFTEPEVLILDEPTRGIDVGAKYEIYMLMKEIAEKGGAVILISSELPEVLNMSNRVLTIFEGRITGEFDPQQASADEIMSAALGMAGSGAKQ